MTMESEVAMQPKVTTGVIAMTPLNTLPNGRTMAYNCTPYFLEGSFVF